MDSLSEDVVKMQMELTKALCAAQAVMQPALKDSTNPHFKSKYADLASIWEACRKPLTDNGLCVTQALQEDTLVTSLRHIGGGAVFSEMKVICKDPTNPQSFGSALTYARRYALAALVGVVTDEDDDGNQAASGQSHVANVLAANEYASSLDKDKKRELYQYVLKNTTSFSQEAIDKHVANWRKSHG